MSGQEQLRLYDVARDWAMSRSADWYVSVRLDGKSKPHIRWTRHER